MKQIVSFEQAERLVELEILMPCEPILEYDMDGNLCYNAMGLTTYDALSIGELIEWIEEHTEAWEILTHVVGHEVIGYNKGHIQVAERSPELIDALVELCIKIKEEA